MTEHLPALLVVVPLLTAALTPLLAYLSAKLIRVTSLLALFSSLLCALGCLSRVLTEGAWHYRFGAWEPPWGIEYVLDPLGASMAILIAFVALVTAFYAWPFYARENWLKKGLFYTLFLLMVSGMLGMVITGDVFNLYVFLEIASLSAYALIASEGKKATVAAFRYLLIGTIGASCYLLGVGYLYAITGTLNMADLSQQLVPLMGSTATLTAVAFFVVGLGIKMALFPSHGWLPDAHAYAPTPISAMLSGLMIKVPAIVMLRIFFFIMNPAEGYVQQALNLIGIIGAAGIIYGSVMAIAQKEIKRLLAYSSMAQIGYIAVGLAIGNFYGLIGALFHILNHAVMKSCLFLIAGAIKWKTGEHTIDKVMGLYKRMPLTMGSFLVAAFSMIGLPPTAGFFSKWYLVLGAFQTGKWPFIVVIILSSLFNAVYFFRLIENIYLRQGILPEEATEGAVEGAAGKAVGGPAEGAAAEGAATVKHPELPVAILGPIILLGAGVLLIGIFNEPLVTQILQYAILGGGR